MSSCGRASISQLDTASIWRRRGSRRHTPQQATIQLHARQLTQIQPGTFDEQLQVYSAPLVQSTARELEYLRSQPKVLYRARCSFQVHMRVQSLTLSPKHPGPNSLTDRGGGAKAHTQVSFVVRKSSSKARGKASKQGKVQPWSECTRMLRDDKSLCMILCNEQASE